MKASQTRIFFMFLYKHASVFRLNIIRKILWFRNSKTACTKVQIKRLANRFPSEKNVKSLKLCIYTICKKIVCNINANIV